MVDKENFVKDINVPSKEPIIIDGVNVGGCKYYLRNIHKSCGQGLVDCEGKDCMFKQLARKTQECEELKKQLETSEEWRIKAEGLNEKLELKNTRYLKALEEIEKIAKDGLNPICYKSNCSRCKCYNGDDCKAGMISLINNYFTQNGEFADGNGDFAEALEDLLDKERSRCNRALPISKKILDIINKTKGGEDER